MNEMRKLMETVAPLFEDDDNTGDETVKSVVGHQDDEVDMIRKQLYQMGMECAEMFRMLGDLPDNADFPHWWQARIVKASEYITTSKHYLKTEIAVDKEQEPPTAEDEIGLDPSGVS